MLIRQREEGLTEKMTGQTGIFLARRRPADHIDTEQFQDDVGLEIKTASQGRQLGDIPGHDLFGYLRLQLGVDVMLDRALVASLKALFLLTCRRPHMFATRRQSQPR